MVDFSKKFGIMVFSYEEMKSYLSKNLVNDFKERVNTGSEIDLEMVKSIAEGMKKWAISRGATHFTHWIHPLSERTGEKHDAFMNVSQSGQVIKSFDWKNLLKSEPDASSFPSGGLRHTFSARGYSVWDYSSFVFVKGKSLYIPALFYSYSGEVLDEKVPLLRSMKALNKSAMRILRIFGENSVKKVYSVVGVEQEYFLVEKKKSEERVDLKFCGRTLFGKSALAEQERMHHYFTTLEPEILNFTEEVEGTLQEIGILAKTKHCEVAPKQYELTQIHLAANLAFEQNKLVMQTLEEVAEKYGFRCLLHEKPFEGMNGSGKHNNWSIMTDTGVNLLEPGKVPEKNKLFLIFLCAVISAVDDYAELLRLSVANHSNDQRLGGNEAPPSIISVYLGEEIFEILKSFETGTKYYRNENIRKSNFGNFTDFPTDTSDRNRTSPFAFNGDRFEFRMVGSSQSIALCNIILNTAVAESLENIADSLENSQNPNQEIDSIVRDIVARHKKIIFNGDNYSESWLEEARKRNLPNLKSFEDSISFLVSKKSVDLFKKHKIFTRREIVSRYKVKLEQYCNDVALDLQAIIKIIDDTVLPFATSYIKESSRIIKDLKEIGIETSSTYRMTVLKQVLDITSILHDDAEEVRTELQKCLHLTDLPKRTKKLYTLYKEKFYELRKSIEEIESIIPKKFRLYPDYDELLS